MSETNTYIKFTNLKKSFGKIEAVKDLSLEVNNGEIVGLLGPDGGGKTTAMRIACGLMTPDSGQASIMEYDCTKQTKDIKKRIGYMPQRFSLYPDLSVEENLRFFADLFDVKKDKRIKREAELYAFSHLEPFKKRHAGRLSGGMKQKLALSCTLIHKPKALILDEPTTGVDPVSRKEFWRILRELANEGIALLVSTPYMDEAELCDRVVLMFEGRVIGAGTTDEVCDLFSRRLLEVQCPDIPTCKSLLENLEGVEVHRFGDRLHVLFENEETADIVRFRLKDIAATVEEIKPTIEDTFVDLLQQKEVADA